MPFVTVLRRTDVPFARLADCGFDTVLREAVASVLGCSAAPLKPFDVDIYHVVRSSTDNTTWDLVILVDAKRVPEREGVLERNRDALTKALTAGIPTNLKYAVRLRLSDEVWGTGEGASDK